MTDTITLRAPLLLLFCLSAAYVTAGGPAQANAREELRRYVWRATRERGITDVLLDDRARALFAAGALDPSDVRAALLPAVRRPEAAVRAAERVRSLVPGHDTRADVLCGLDAAGVLHQGQIVAWLVEGWLGSSESGDADFLGFTDVHGRNRLGAILRYAPCDGSGAGASGDHDLCFVGVEWRAGEVVGERLREQLIGSR